MARQNWNGAPSVPSYPQEGTIDAARHLALMARRFAQDRACRREVDEAITMWREACEKRWPTAAPVPAEPNAKERVARAESVEEREARHRREAREIHEREAAEESGPRDPPKDDKETE